MRVLVVDDDPMVRMLLVGILADAGYEVLAAPGGGEAIMLIDDPGHIDLVVTDLNMPGHDGVDVAVKAQVNRPQMPVLYVTGRPDLLAARQPAGAYRVLGKPFSSGKLLAILDEMLDPRQMRPDAG
jgi:DNA-binding NtrC family response regulator